MQPTKSYTKAALENYLVQLYRTHSSTYTRSSREGSSPVFHFPGSERAQRLLLLLYVLNVCLTSSAHSLLTMVVVVVL